MAKLIARAKSSHKNLESHEKVQFDAFVLQKISIQKDSGTGSQRSRLYRILGQVV